MAAIVNIVSRCDLRIETCRRHQPNLIRVNQHCINYGFTLSVIYKTSVHKWHDEAL